MKRTIIAVLVAAISGAALSYQDDYGRRLYCSKRAHVAFSAVTALNSGVSKADIYSAAKSTAIRNGIDTNMIGSLISRSLNFKDPAEAAAREAVTCLGETTL